ncbi:hypothetical protein EXU85_20585 [Spirosoma sp. KCTC 42546]|uniref:phage antirepressor KilAC domain-containing protein n=1 Tax=Spirosoma sp. KCTC 42546 TaxID=2520506 RepID=UPI00115BC048|nr:phage antirepressor KilAC domain-containing protein [Spirosoma sp. KCTC 42546]QDK80878.1 hypothetical protein EXU85_20585 [Spirosoma sp. KCTC 42546]
MSQLQIFQYNGFDVDFELIDGQIYANASAMCKPFNRRINDWSSLAATVRYLNALRSKPEITVPLSISRLGGVGGGSQVWIHEKLILKLAQWLDVDFEIWCDERVAEVLKGKKQVALPQTYKEALQALLVEVEQKEQLQLQVESLKPKADYADAVLSSTTEITTTTIAAELGMSAVSLNKKLHALRIQRKLRGTWILYLVHADKGYAHLRTHPYTDRQGNPKSKHYLVWTETGRQFIHSKLSGRLTSPKAVVYAGQHSGIA